MANNLIRIDVRSILEFYDEAVPTSRHHATAINAVAGEELGAGLLAHYFCQKGIAVEILPGACTQGTRSGVRLDRWIRTRRGRHTVYFQTEIKNWSAHAIGGRQLKIAVSPRELAMHKMERWSKEWNGSTFRAKGAKKVLTPIKRPTPYARVEPLICFWDAMHPKGKADPLFHVATKNRHFPRVWVFSMSAYLRILLSSGTRRIALTMPDTVRRTQWLHDLFTVPSSH